LEASVKVESEFYRSLLDNFYDGVYFVDRERRITYWNSAAERITGYTAEDTVGSFCYDELLQHVDLAGTRLCFGLCPVAATIADGVRREAEVFLHHKQGHRVPVLVRVAPLVDVDGEVIGAVEVFSDNSSKMAALQRVEDLEKTAYLDPLTGLANRALTEITIRARLEELARYEWPFSVLFVDVDQFKSINDNLGHPVGDAFLRAVGNTLRGAARAFDLVGRWGGDEFVVLLANTDLAKLAVVAERFRVLIQGSVVTTGDAEHVVTVSIGGAEAVDGDTVESVVARADAAMYRSKQGGRNRVTIDGLPDPLSPSPDVR
jgi:diguanylate cyclase (GGDEF)-like protein/PAS domain S-box-containing protein